ncbi:HAMP domain-containing sensor histidine kinase [Paracoccus sp. CPCC 101403]|uniref:histidine kinase n=1 Tax=Paracoccus broussonetiae TaxID=3075834 RepID=A0ABU3EKH3_9RHOB|nr:HAMP domain-containing sensor histidine kinase [Paracoccus sp. CPCC 101403]MDT1064600.1 HAMP domain-containing sensor histidine kinase [Paracoccus sp. CPCC 101403]
MNGRAQTLRWRITRGLILFQIVAFMVLSIVMLGLVFHASFSGVIVSGEAGRAVAASIVRDGDGVLVVRPNESLRTIREASPSFWFIVEAEDGARVMSGAPPAFALNMIDDAARLKAMDMRSAKDDPNLTAKFERRSGPAGELYLLVGGGAFISDFKATLLLALLVIVVPVTVLILLTLAIVPAFVRRSLNGILDVSRQVAQIDYDSRGRQLPSNDLPDEIVPIIEGMNEALRRLDAGIEATEQFFMNAAHELRTPIAIAQLRIDALPDGPDRDNLRQITRRLATMAHQLLEIERFRQGDLAHTSLDLGEILSEAVADLAPYAVARGYDLALEKPEQPVRMTGDRESLDRMIVNLVQNAVQHGGGRGTIAVRLDPSGIIEVQDEGPGIPFEHWNHVFEPFYRRNPHGAGAGLGLKMVRDIAQAHGGEVNIVDGSFGATFRIRLPVQQGQSTDQKSKKGR